jgi:hypothetical protein
MMQRFKVILWVMGTAVFLALVGFMVVLFIDNANLRAALENQKECSATLADMLVKCEQDSLKRTSIKYLIQEH